MEKIERILVVNRTKQYIAAEIQSAMALARKYGSEVMVLHLLNNPVDMEALNAPLPYSNGRKPHASIEEEAREELEMVLRKEGFSSLPLKIMVKAGKPADVIAKVVKDEQIDLMLLVTYEQGRIEHMLFGRDTDEIIRSMPCSMLLVKKEPEGVTW